MKQKARRRLAALSIAAAFLYLLGIGSSILSRRAAAIDTEHDATALFAGAQNGAAAQRLTPEEVTDRFASQPYDSSELVGEYRTLARFLPLRLPEPREAASSWSYVNAQATLWPFIVRVDYGRYAKFSYGPCGSAGSRVYVGIFGKAVIIRDYPTVMW
jgi:hypothetical protein